MQAADQPCAGWFGGLVPAAVVGSATARGGPYHSQRSCLASPAEVASLVGWLVRSLWLTTMRACGDWFAESLRWRGTLQSTWARLSRRSSCSTACNSDGLRALVSHRLRHASQQLSGAKRLVDDLMMTELIAEQVFRSVASHEERGNGAMSRPDRLDDLGP